MLAEKCASGSAEVSGSEEGSDGGSVSELGRGERKEKERWGKDRGTGKMREMPRTGTGMEGPRTRTKTETRLWGNHCNYRKMKLYLKKILFNDLLFGTLGFWDTRECVKSRMPRITSIQNFGKTAKSRHDQGMWDLTKK
jgi:hypothetical protein